MYWGLNSTTFLFADALRFKSCPVRFQPRLKTPTPRGWKLSEWVATPGIMEKKMETLQVYWGYMGIMDKKMETLLVYWGCMGIMDKTMETLIA